MLDPHAPGPQVAPQDAGWPAFVCPRCRTPVDANADGWHCSGCARDYPQLFGIADFRLEADPWIGLDDDRDKARRLIESTPDASFAETVRAYWAMTPSTPQAQAERFIDAVLSAEDRTNEWLDLPTQAPVRTAPTNGPVLDLGCGTGEMLAALDARGVRAIGVDVAMRWLVQARRRDALRGGRQLLVCCNAEYLPFPDSSVGAVVSLGMLEHCRDASVVLRDAHRVLQRGGAMRLRTVNRFGLLPEPHVGVWGVGFMPRRWADGYVQWRSGQRYLHHRPVSAGELRRALVASGFKAAKVTAATLLSSDVQRLPLRLRPLGDAYVALRALPAVGRLLSMGAPLLEAAASA